MAFNIQAGAALSGLGPLDSETRRRRYGTPSSARSGNGTQPQSQPGARPACDFVDDIWFEPLASDFSQPGFTAELAGESWSEIFALVRSERDSQSLHQEPPGPSTGSTAQYGSSEDDRNLLNDADFNILSIVRTPSASGLSEASTVVFGRMESDSPSQQIEDRWPSESPSPSVLRRERLDLFFGVTISSEQTQPSLRAESQDTRSITGRDTTSSEHTQSSLQAESQDTWPNVGGDFLVNEPELNEFIIYELHDGDSHQIYGMPAELFKQMMFVSGETGEPSVETTSLVEEIVRQQVVEILTQSNDLAIRAGRRTIGVQDLFFLIRRDHAKTARLKMFLSWKDVRRNVKDADEKGGDADVGAEDPLAEGGGGPTVETGKKNKRNKIVLPWDPESFYSERVPERDDEEDEDEDEYDYATKKRLMAADERTKGMTKEEYVHFSECRQASFTFRKGKRFREWAGFGVVTESKPNDDIIDILGFLTFEMVQTLTEEGLRVKAEEDKFKSKSGGSTQDKKRKRETGLFDPPEESNAPVGVAHVREGYRRLQSRANQPRYWLGPPGVPRRERIQLI